MSQTNLLVENDKTLSVSDNGWFYSWLKCNDSDLHFPPWKFIESNTSVTNKLIVVLNWELKGDQTNQQEWYSSRKRCEIQNKEIEKKKKITEKLKLILCWSEKCYLYLKTWENNLDDNAKLSSASETWNRHRQIAETRHV